MPQGLVQKALPDTSLASTFGRGRAGAEGQGQPKNFPLSLQGKKASRGPWTRAHCPRTPGCPQRVTVQAPPRGWIRSLVFAVSQGTLEAVQGLVVCGVGRARWA